MAKLCPACSKANPANANYCYYDGRRLSQEGQEEPLQVGALPLPTPFYFPDGQSCANFNQLALACDARWDEARALLADGTWHSYFGAIGRLDLAAAAKQAVREPNLDVGLSQLLEKFPTDPNTLRQPQLSLPSAEENLGALTPGTDRRFELMISNRGLLVLRGMATTNCDWLSLGDGAGSALKMFQTRGIYTLPVRVLGNRLRAGAKPLQGEIVIDTNGGAITVPVRAEIPVRPFPGGTQANDVFAGAKSPREIALKAKTNLLGAAVLFEQGAVKSWYASNGWTYPVQGTQASGKGAVQQFFDALGLSKPPRLEIDTKSLLCKDTVGRRLTQHVTISTTEPKLVYAQAWSNQHWIKAGPGKPQGNKVTIPLQIEVPPCPGETLHANVTIQGNGNQQFVVPVTLAVSAARSDMKTQAEGPAGSPRAVGGSRSLGALIGGVLCFLLIAGAVGGVGALVYILNLKSNNTVAVTPPADKDKTPPPANKDKTPPPANKDKTPPTADKDKTPPTPDKDKTPPTPDQDKKPADKRGSDKWTPPTVSGYTTALGDDDAAVRAEAAKGLGRLGPAAGRAASALAAALHDDNAPVRAFAAEALGKLGPTTRQIALRPLLYRYADNDASVVAASKRALERLGGLTANDRDVVVDVLKDWKCDVRIRLRVLAAVGDMKLKSDAAVQLYALALRKDQGPAVCKEAARLLGAVDDNGKPAAFTALATDGLHNPDPEVAAAVVKALNNLGTPTAGDAAPLADVLKDAGLTPSARIAAAQLLGSVGPAVKESAYPALTRALLDPNNQVRDAAENALALVGSPGRPETKLLGEVTAAPGALPDALQAAARALGKSEPDARSDALPLLAPLLLARLLDRPHPPEVRMAALDALTALRQLPGLGPFTPDETKLFLPAMKDADSPKEVRQFVMRACGEAGKGAADALDAVLQALRKDSDKDVRVLAAGAAAHVAPPGDSDKKKQVVQALDSALSDKDWQVREAAARAVGEIGRCPGVLGALLKALADKKDAVVKAANEGLGKYESPDWNDDFGTICNALKSDLAPVRRFAAKALADHFAAKALADHPESGTDLAVTQLAEATKDSDAEVQASAVRALYCIGPAASAASTALADATKSPNPRMRVYAAVALLKLHKEPDTAVPVALDAITGSDEELKKLAREGLQKLGLEATESTVRILITALKDPEKRAIASKTLTQETLKGVRKSIVKGLKENLDLMENKPKENYDHDLCLVIIQALGDLGPDADAARVQVQKHCNGETNRLFPEDTPDIRRAALNAYKRMTPPSK